MIYNSEMGIGVEVGTVFHFIKNIALESSNVKLRRMKQSIKNKSVNELPLSNVMCFF